VVEEVLNETFCVGTIASARGVLEEGTDAGAQLIIQARDMLAIVEVSVIVDLVDFLLDLRKTSSLATDGTGTSATGATTAVDP
jgi:hypothetical protein